MNCNSKYVMNNCICNIGLVAMPTSMFNNTPLECTICRKDLGNCDFMMDQRGFYIERFNPVDDQKNVTDPKHNGAWVNKFCTMTEVHSFILYFPYCLILLPLLIISIHKVLNK